MARNSGKPSEELFDAHFARLGKRAVVFQLYDAAYISGLLGKATKVQIPAQPSDRIVTVDGETHYAEVKSTQDPTAFRFQLLRKSQSSAATRVLAAGGSYLVYVHRLLTNTWYRFSYDLIAQIKAQGKSSIPWADLEPFMQENF